MLQGRFLALRSNRKPNQHHPNMKTSLRSSRLASLTVLLVPLVAVQSSNAATFTPGAGFSAASNPSGLWSYVYSTSMGGALILHATSDNLAGFPEWRTNLGSNAPAAGYNNTGSAVTVGTATVGAGEFTLHPGPDGELAILRFTSPALETYTVAGSFFGQDFVFPTSTDVHLLVNGVSIWDSAVNGFGPSSATAFSQTVTLAPGGTLDFAVGIGGVHYFGDSTGLSASITSVPEPSSALLGLAALGLLARRRR
jgi:MYXO-CTERM domain-containing protein